MAKLAQLPSQGIIDLYAGVVDFYVYHPCGPSGPGIPCARSWPKYDDSVMTAASKAARIPFAYVNQKWADLSPRVQQAWQEMASMTGLTARDLSVRAYLNGSKL